MIHRLRPSVVLPVDRINGSTQTRQRRRKLPALQPHIRSRLLVAAALLVSVVFFTTDVAMYTSTGSHDPLRAHRRHLCTGVTCGPPPYRRDDLCCSGSQVDKLLYLMTDGEATDQATAAGLFEPFRHHANWYRVRNEGYRQSNAVYTMYYTGKTSNNIMGNAITGDTTWGQMKAAGKELLYMGGSIPTRLVPSDDPWYEQGDIHEDAREVFVNTLGQANTVEKTKARMDELTRGGSISNYWQTETIDHINHKAGRFTPDVKMACKVFTEKAERVKAWVDEHPDYLLMVVSDHGGRDKDGNTDRTMHGGMDGGNEPFAMFYHANLTPQDAGSWIHVSDLAVTQTQYIRGVSIPFESYGVVAPVCRHCVVDTYKMVVRNALQLTQLCDTLGVPYDTEVLSESALMAPLRDSTAEGDATLKARTDTVLAQLRLVQASLTSRRVFPSGPFAWVTCVLIVAQVAVSVWNYGGCGGFVAHVRWAFPVVVVPPVITYLFLEFPLNQKR